MRGVKETVRTGARRLLELAPGGDACGSSVLPECADVSRSLVHLPTTTLVSHDVCGTPRRRSDPAPWHGELVFVPDQSRLRERRSLLF